MHRQKNYKTTLFTGVIGVAFFFMLVDPQSLCAADSLRFFNSLRAGADLYYGIITPHHGSIAYLVNSPVKGFELDLFTDSYGHSAWDRKYRYPRYGMGYLHTTLGNSVIYGNGNALFLFLDIPFNRQEHSVSAAYRMNIGLGHLSRQFNPNSNPLDLAISSKWNIYLRFESNVKLRLTTRSELVLGLGFSHFSNGKLDTPNLGLNIASVRAGYNYSLKQEIYQKKVSIPDPVLPHNNIILVYSGGAKTDDQITGKYYLVSTLVADFVHNTSLRYSFGGGCDFFYDQSLGPNKVAEEHGGTYSNADLFQMGIHAGFFARYGRLNTVVNLGAYVLADYYKYSRVYSRIGIRYQLYRNILFNLTLKAHYAIADYFEWGIAYRIPYK